MHPEVVYGRVGQQLLASANAARFFEEEGDADRINVDYCKHLEDFVAARKGARLERTAV